MCEDTALGSRSMFWGWNVRAVEGSGRHRKGQLGSAGLADALNFSPHDWEANKGFKTAVTVWGWAFGEDDTAIYGCSWVAFQAFLPGGVFTALTFRLFCPCTQEL